MKKIILALAIVCTLSPVYAQQQGFGLNQEILIDSNRSIINWEGSDLLNLNKHNGTVKFKIGTIKRSSNAITGDIIVGGVFEIDMNSIVNTDGDHNEMLVTHLKNEDFFNVKKYPIATLEIINVLYRNATNLDITAYLTINDIRQIITYRSTIENVNNQIMMKSKFEIDRTLWGINYKSKISLPV